MTYVHQDSGLINVAYFKFDVDDTSGELDANRPVPFRLTPNILEFLTSTGNDFYPLETRIDLKLCLSSVQVFLGL